MQIRPLTGEPARPVRRYPGLFSTGEVLEFDPKRYRLMNDRLWRIVGGTNSSPTLMGIDLQDVVVQSETPFQAEMDASAGMGGLGDLSPVEILSVQAAQANAAVSLLATLASQGARTPRSTIEAWQRSWNARKGAVELAARALGSAALADAIRGRVLTVDGYWGPNTAFTTAVWISTSLPATRLADMAAWWRTNGAAVGQRRDTIAAAYRAAQAAPSAAAAEALPEPPVASPPPPPPQPEPPPPPPAGQPYDASTRTNTPTTTGSGGAAASSSSTALLVGVAAVAGVAAVLYMRSRKSGGALAELDAAPKRPSPALLKKAVEAMRLLIGSVDRVSLRDEQRLHARARKAVEEVEKASGVTDAWEQIEKEARRLGGRLATPAKDI
jgi:hypothetical protein